MSPAALPGMSSFAAKSLLSAALAALSALSAAASAGPPARLSLNENPFGPSPLALEAIRADLPNIARYATAAEADALAARIAAYEGVPVSHVVIGEVLEPLGRHLALRPGPGGAGGEFVYSNPGYTALVEAARPFGGTGVPVPLNDRLENDLPALLAAITPRTRALFLVNPHNPSGTASGAAELHAFLREAAARTLVIVDEAYLDYTDDYERATAVALIREGADVVVFRTLGKIHGLAGLQIGYALAPAPLADSLRQAGIGRPGSLNRLAVAAAEASLRDTARLAETRLKTAAGRSAWLAALDELGLRRTDARGSFVFFRTGRPHREVAAAFLAEGIDIGRGFPALDDWVRVTVGTPDENARAIAALRRIFSPPAAPSS